MVDVRKRDGSLEGFDANKLEISLLNARATGVDTAEVSEFISSRAREGIPTSEIKTLVTNELKRLDKDAARRYHEHHGLVKA